MIDRNPLYIYTGSIDRVIDGDTIDCTIDVGFNLRMTDRIRLFGVQAPEISCDAGILASQYLTELVQHHGSSITFYSIKNRREQFGRYLAIVYFGSDVSSTISVNRMMLDAGHAVPKYISKQDLGLL